MCTKFYGAAYEVILTVSCTTASHTFSTVACPAGYVTHDYLASEVRSKYLVHDFKGRIGLGVYVMTEYYIF